MSSRAGNSDHAMSAGKNGSTTELWDTVRMALLDDDLPPLDEPLAALDSLRSRMERMEQERDSEFQMRVAANERRQRIEAKVERMEEVVEAAWNTPEHLRGDRINAALASLDQEEAHA